MEGILTQKLRSYIIQNNPDLLFGLQEDFSLISYVDQKIKQVRPLLDRLLTEGKPNYIIEELCLNEMTAELQPSKYLFLHHLLEEDFEPDFHRMKMEGILTYEIANLIEVLALDFENYAMTDDSKEFSSDFRYFIMPRIQQYLADQLFD